MALKWYRYHSDEKSTNLFTKIRVEYRIPKSLFIWLAENAKLSQAGVIELLRAQPEKLDGWHTVAVDEDGDARIIHVDDVNQVEDDGDVVYPESLTSFPGKFEPAGPPFMEQED